MVLDTTPSNLLSNVGWRESFDSGNFSIIRRYYNSNIKYVESRENKLTELCDWQEWYKNGNIKKEGTMTNSSHQYVGIWKYYSPSGKLDSVVDHDKTYPIPYFKALKIAKTYGFSMPDMEVTLTWEKDKVYYQVARWRESQDHNGQTAEYIYIDTKTGVVTRPDKLLISIY
jgi:antitoxin component YwqK of YwqJK toxin-antitoxin module